MNEEFVKKLFYAIAVENNALYRDLFENTKLEDCDNEYWIKAITLYNSLDDTNKEVFFDIIVQIMIDTISNVLGIVDGSSTLEEGEDWEISMQINGENTEMELQDAFMDYLEDLTVD